MLSSGLLLFVHPITWVNRRSAVECCFCFYQIKNWAVAPLLERNEISFGIRFCSILELMMNAKKNQCSSTTTPQPVLRARAKQPPNARHDAGSKIKSRRRREIHTRIRMESLELRTKETTLEMAHTPHTKNTQKNRIKEHSHPPHTGIFIFPENQKKQKTHASPTHMPTPRIEEEYIERSSTKRKKQHRSKRRRTRWPAQALLSDRRKQRLHTDEKEEGSNCHATSFYHTENNTHHATKEEHSWKTSARCIAGTWDLP